MRSNPRNHHPTDADRIDALWDRINDPNTQEERSHDVSRHSDDTLDNAAGTISLLAAMAPSVEEESLARIRKTFEAGIEKETGMRTLTHKAPASGVLRRPASLPSVGTRRLRHVPQALDRIAAATLILVVIGSVLMAGPGRGLMPKGVEHQLAALPGFETGKQSPSQGDRSLTSIYVVPGESPAGQIEVGLWRVTLPPGASIEIPASFHKLGKQSVSQFVESGNVVLGGNGLELTATAERNTGMSALDYYRNDGNKPVVMLLLAPAGEKGAFPFTISSAPDSSTPRAMAPGSKTTLLGTNTVSTKDGFQIRVTLGTLHYAETLDPAMRHGYEPAYVLIEKGEISVHPAANAGTQAPGIAYGTGETIQFGTADQRNATFTDSGSTPLSALLVTTSPMSDNPTLNQSTKAAAPYWTTWMVPESGTITLSFRRLTIQPEGTYALPTGAGIAYSVVTGTVELSVDGGESTTLLPGSVVGQNPGTTLSFSATGNAQAVLVQSVVTAIGEDAFTAEMTQNTTIRTMVETEAQLPAGPASIMLEQRSYSGGNGAHSSSEGSPSVTLATAAQGIISVGRMGGEVAIVTSPDSGDVKAPLGTSIAIGEGGYLLAHPGSGWSMSGDGTKPSIGVALTISPVDAGASTPRSGVATPTASGQSIVLNGKTVNCTIAPLTTEDVNRIMATPVAATGPLERSLKNQGGGHSNVATTDAITQLLQGYVDCSASGNYPQMYAFYSDQAIRDNQTLRDLVEREWKVGRGPARASVEDIVLFDDGHAGARTAIDGEPAYLTFVKQNGEWKIDVWDDSGSAPQVLATPQS